MTLPGITAAMLIWALSLYVVSTAADKSAWSLKTLVNRSNEFSTEYFKTISSEKKGENFISSPLSVYMQLSTLAYGAKGPTFNLLNKKLKLPSNIRAADASFQSLINGLNNIRGADVAIANKIYVAKNFSLNSNYTKIMTGVFKAEASAFDPTSKTAADNINSWVDKKTNHKISKLLESEDINKDTQLISLNVLYFKSQWKKPFNEHYTYDTAWYTKEDEYVMVPAMHDLNEYFIGSLPGAKFIEIPYKNEELKMVIIVPKEVDGLEKLEKNLTSFTYENLLREKSRSKIEINLSLPKFKIESSINLEKTFEKLNIGNIFTDSANFKGISNNNLKVDKAIQKAYIEVNENGSEAAAASGLLYGFYQMNEFNVDRPFCFFIVKSNITLFQGHVIFPKYE